MWLHQTGKPTACHPLPTLRNRQPLTWFMLLHIILGDQKRHRSTERRCQVGRFQVRRLSLLGGASMASVNIVYPINGGSYPITDPAPGVLASAYFTASFSVTCDGGPHAVAWGFDASPALGKAKFYDQISVQFVHKLPGGSHYFWVDAGDCGKARVKFKIGT